MEDFQLVELSRTGQKNAFSSLIDKYYKNIYRFAFGDLKVRMMLMIFARKRF